MDNKQEVTVKGSIGFTGALQLLFIALKLTGFIKWPWVWVLSPIWISAIIAIGVIAIVALVIIANLGE